MNKINLLCTDRYLFTPQLREALLTGINPKRCSKYVEKYQQGFYLLFIQILNKQDKSLVYNYIYYEELFCLCLMSFLGQRLLYNTLYNEE